MFEIDFEMINITYVILKIPMKKHTQIQSNI